MPESLLQDSLLPDDSTREFTPFLNGAEDTPEMSGRKGLNFNLLDQLVFYGSYHNNIWNQIIHFVFVPAIQWSVMVWLAAGGEVLPGKLQTYTDPFFPHWLQGAATLNASVIVLIAYGLFYVLLDALAGLSWTLCVGVPMWLTASAFQAQVPHAWAWALGVHVFSWYMQIHPGHAICEGRKPALLDSLGQAFALAPLFVWFELLFLLGYRPALHAQLKGRVDAELEKRRERLKGRYSEADPGVKVAFYLRVVPRNPAPSTMI